MQTFPEQKVLPLLQGIWKTKLARQVFFFQLNNHNYPCICVCSRLISRKEINLQIHIDNRHRWMDKDKSKATGTMHANLVFRSVQFESTTFPFKKK